MATDNTMLSPRYTFQLATTLPLVSSSLPSSTTTFPTLFLSPDLMKEYSIPHSKHIFLKIAPSIAPSTPTTEQPPARPATQPILTPIRCFPEPQLDFHEVILPQQWSSAFSSQFPTDITHLLQCTILTVNQLYHDTNQYQHWIQQQSTYTRGINNELTLLYCTNLVVSHATAICNDVERVSSNAFSRAHFASIVNHLAHQYASAPLLCPLEASLDGSLRLFLSLLGQTFAFSINSFSFLMPNIIDSIVSSHSAASSPSSSSLPSNIIFSIAPSFRAKTNISLLIPSSTSSHQHHDPLHQASMDKSSDISPQPLTTTTNTTATWPPAFPSFPPLSSRIQPSQILPLLDNPSLFTQQSWTWFHFQLLYSLIAVFQHNSHSAVSSPTPSRTPPPSAHHSTCSILPITGPSRSGKTTTLFQTLHHFRSLYLPPVTSSHPLTNSYPSSPVIITFDAIELYQCLAPISSRFDDTISSSHIFQQFATVWVSRALIAINSIDIDQNRHNNNDNPRSIPVLIWIDHLDFVLRLIGFQPPTTGTGANVMTYTDQGNEATSNDSTQPNLSSEESTCRPLVQALFTIISQLQVACNNPQKCPSSTSVLWCLESSNISPILTLLPQQLHSIVRSSCSTAFLSHPETHCFALTFLLQLIATTPKTSTETLSTVASPPYLCSEEKLLLKLFSSYQQYCSSLSSCQLATTPPFSKMLVKYIKFCSPIIGLLVPQLASSDLTTQFPLLFAFPNYVQRHTFEHTEMSNTTNDINTSRDILTYIMDIVVSHPGVYTAALSIANLCPNASFATLQAIMAYISSTFRHFSISYPSPSITMSMLILNETILQSLIQNFQHSQPCDIKVLHDMVTMSTTSSSMTTVPKVPTQQIPSKSCTFGTFIGDATLIEKLSETLKLWQLSLSQSSSTAQSNIPSSINANILLHGPTGTGKTLLASIMASSGDVSVSTNSSSRSFNIIRLNPSDVFQKYLGDSELKIRQTFARARAQSPCVIIIDNIDVIACNRDSIGTGSSDHGGVETRILSTLLNELDGIVTSSTGSSSGQNSTSGTHLHVIATCQDITKVDSALLRSGRFDLLFDVPLPSSQHNYQLLRREIDMLCPEFDHNEFLKTLAEKCTTQQLSAAATLNIIRHAFMIAFMDFQQTKHPSVQPSRFQLQNSHLIQAAKQANIAF